MLKGSEHNINQNREQGLRKNLGAASFVLTET